MAQQHLPSGVSKVVSLSDQGASNVGLTWLTVCRVSAITHMDVHSSWGNRSWAGFDPETLICQPLCCITTLCVSFLSHRYNRVTVTSSQGSNNNLGWKREGRRTRTLTRRTRFLTSMRSRCPAFVPFSTNTCLKTEKMGRHSEPHEADVRLCPGSWQRTVGSV